MTAVIDELIDKQDTAEQIRDLIGTILATEIVNQQSLATTAGKDPRLWKLRVFVERANPWEHYIDAPDNDSDDAIPTVNITLNSQNTDEGRSNTVERQRVKSTLYIDCIGYGKPEATGSGHLAGDEKAAFEAQRAVRLVRNILMAGHYTYLGSARGQDQLVLSRMVSSVTYFQPEVDRQAIPNVLAARINFDVEHNETSPQVEGTPLSTVDVDVKRLDTGEVIAEVQLDVS